MFHLIFSPVYIFNNFSNHFLFYCFVYYVFAYSFCSIFSSSFFYSYFSSPSFFTLLGIVISSLLLSYLTFSSSLFIHVSLLLFSLLPLLLYSSSILPSHLPFSSSLSFIYLFLFLSFILSLLYSFFSFISFFFSFIHFPLYSFLLFKFLFFFSSFSLLYSLLPPHLPTPLPPSTHLQYGVLRCAVLNRRLQGRLGVGGAKGVGHEPLPPPRVILPRVQLPELTGGAGRENMAGG